MSAETFTTAMFLITAVIAAGVLINAVFPVVYNMAGTFSSATHESDERLRTDFKIVTTWAGTDPDYGGYNSAKVWIKNIGSSRIPLSDITNRSDVFCGQTGNYDRFTYTYTGVPGDKTWIAELLNSGNNYWDPGETIKITAYSSTVLPSSGSDKTVYFQFILPNGIWRSTEFNTVSV